MDRNSAVNSNRSAGFMSLSARRAWIEIVPYLESLAQETVALRKESVDRNPLSCASFIRLMVALRKESVDRNSMMSRVPFWIVWSLSARRAWIEI